MIDDQYRRTGIPRGLVITVMNGFRPGGGPLDLSLSRLVIPMLSSSSYETDVINY